MARFARLLALAGALLAACLPAVAVDLFNNTNTGGVQNGAKAPTFLNGSTSHIGQIETYHWNNGRGATPGTIMLKSANGQTWGPFKATGSAGQGNAPNVNWYVNVDITIPLGTYEIIDSDPATWSQNAATRGIGFAIVRGDRVAPQATPPAPVAQNTQSRLPPAPPSPVTPGPATAKPLPPTTVPTVRAPTVPAPAPAPAAPAPASSAASTDLFNNTNTGGVQNGAKGEVLLITFTPVHITQLETYHWNDGRGAKPGTLTLKNASGNPVYGPFPAKGLPGTNNVPNVNWVADVNLELPSGTYQLVDSDPATWSQNAQSHGIGFAIIRGAHEAPTYATPAKGGPAPGTVPPAPKPPVLPGAVPAGGAPAGGGTYTPCMSNAGAIATMSPCMGGPGTRITIKLNRNLNAPLKEITFRPYQVTGIPGGVGAAVLAPVSGNSKTAGSYYEVTVPQQLCLGKGGSWDLFPSDTNNQGQGDIGRFTVQCGPGAVAGGSGAPAPTTAPPPPAPSAAPFKPCYTNSGSVASISPCTTIRPGDIVTIQVIQRLQSPIKTVTFKPRQLALPGATAAAVIVTMAPNGATNVGGMYNFALPPQICLSGRGSWDAWPTDANNRGLGDIGQVNVVCQ